ncbi:hypothetical protein RDI58_018166 [Solanum bulbocastanum]|uniref:DUF4218 domain-containing protein n=1 Tax=Solanum bulbocastanum TaxID=147425 RepID=A0AAN8TG06_SOLBU
MVGAKLLRIDDLEQVETQIPVTLCKLEKVFPPSFFLCHGALAYSLS